MIIYATSFNKDDKEIIDLSVDSSFKSISNVVNAIGDKYIKLTKRMVIYDGVVFSDFPFKLDSLVRCSVCNGNNKDMPCAYPGENLDGCLNS